jgi:hypothetical protein
MNAKRWWEFGAIGVLSLFVAIGLIILGTFAVRRHTLIHGLARAMDANDGATVRSLYRQSIFLYARDTHGRTPLIWASVFGDEQLVRQALQSGEDVNAKAQNDMTALMWAALGGHVTVVRTLLAACAEINARDAQGRTALSWAADGLRSPDPARKRAVIQALRSAGGTR